MTITNLSEYIRLTSDWILWRGIARQLEAFNAGFASVFPPRRLRAFSPEELRLMLCGQQAPHWTREDLLNYTEPKLGYTRERYIFCQNIIFSGYIAHLCYFLALDF